jgi:hypothetical protein
LHNGFNNVFHLEGGIIKYAQDAKAQGLELKFHGKNFVFDIDTLDGHIQDFTQEQDKFYRKFFIDEHSDEFFQTMIEFAHTHYDHKHNIKVLQSKLTQSFVHVVSESMSTSYLPFVTEKFLHSVITRGLFVAYGQPGWHEYLSKYLGFRLYDKIFDYHFDQIQNPVHRVVNLVTMISKFKQLSWQDCHDIYLLEQETIEYNYDWFFGRGYLKCLKNFYS